MCKNEILNVLKAKETLKILIKECQNELCIKKYNPRKLIKNFNDKMKVRSGTPKRPRR